MADIQNERDKRLQSATTRFIPPPIDPSLIPGYQDALEDIDDLKDSLGDIGDEINHLMNNSRDLRIYATTLTFTNTSGTTVPSSTTLTAVKGSGLTGTVSWSVVAGSATLSSSTGDSITVTGSTISGRSATIRARVTMSGANYDAYVTLTRLGAIAASNVVNLTSQVTGSLAAGNVSGLGALALLNAVDLSTQTTGALNGLTQVTNLGNLAYANSVAANQIGAGTLAAGVIYSGVINASQVNSGSFVGKTFTGGIFTGALFRTATSGARVVIDSEDTSISFINSTGRTTKIQPYGTGGDNGMIINADGSGGGVRISNEGTGPSLICYANSSSNGAGVLGWASGGNPGISAAGGGTAGPQLRIVPGSTPSNKVAGGISFVNGELLISDGTHWYKVLKEQVT